VVHCTSRGQGSTVKDCRDTAKGALLQKVYSWEIVTRAEAKIGLLEAVMNRQLLLKGNAPTPLTENRVE